MKKNLNAIILMGLTIVRQTTNVKPPRSNEPLVITTPTTGNLRLNEAACAKIGVTAEDYVGFAEAADDAGNPVMAIHKGKAGTETETAIGAKLMNPSGKTAGTMQCSSANTYNKLIGKVEPKIYANSVVGKNNTYEIGEGEVVNGAMLGMEGDIEVFPLIFVRADEPMQREENTKEGGEAAETRKEKATA